MLTLSDLLMARNIMPMTISDRPKGLKRAKDLKESESEPEEEVTREEEEIFKRIQVCSVKNLFTHSLIFS